MKSKNSTKFGESKCTECAVPAGCSEGNCPPTTDTCKNSAVVDCLKRIISDTDIGEVQCCLQMIVDGKI